MARRVWQIAAWLGLAALAAEAADGRRKQLLLERGQLRLEREQQGPDVNELCAPWREVPQGACPATGKHNLCSDLPELCRGGSHRRCEMPQIPPPPQAGESSAAWDEWAARLQAQNISYTLALNVSVGSLINDYSSAQSQLDACEVCGIFFAGSQCFAGRSEPPTSAQCAAGERGCFCAWNSGISVAAVGMQILDGHHRWAATKLIAAGLPGGLRAAFEAQTTRVQSYNASVDDIRSLSGTVDSVNETACGVFEARSAGAGLGLGARGLRCLALHALAAALAAALGG